jgi:hypothetical protein
VLYLANDFVCNYMICYYSETPRVFERVKGIMRCKAMHATHTPKHLVGVRRMKIIIMMTMIMIMVMVMVMAMTMIMIMMIMMMMMMMMVVVVVVGVVIIDLSAPQEFSPERYSVAWHLRMADGPAEEGRLQSIHGNDKEYFMRSVT